MSTNEPTVININVRDILEQAARDELIWDISKHDRYEMPEDFISSPKRLMEVIHGMVAEHGADITRFFINGNALGRFFTLKPVQQLSDIRFARTARPELWGAPVTTDLQSFFEASRAWFNFVYGMDNTLEHEEIFDRILEQQHTIGIVQYKNKWVMLTCKKAALDRASQ